MASTTTATQARRISAADLRRRLDRGEAATILDVRAPQAWQSSNSKARGAVRVEPESFRPDRSWPKDRLTVTYCT